jgi:putative DNA-invertase from lambdoid prophage Rac
MVAKWNMRTVAYLRVSTDKQDIESQRFGVDKFVKEKGIIIDRDDWFEEIVTGSKKVSERNLGEVLSGLKRGDCIIFSEVSRIGRKFYDTMIALQQCLDRGIQVMTVKERYVLGDDIQSKIMAMAFGLSAEIERNFISVRTKEGLDSRRNNGERYGHLPYGKCARVAGVRANGKNIQLVEDDKDELKIIARLNELRLTESYRAITERLNSEGILCRGRKWNVKKVYKAINYGKKKSDADDSTNTKILGASVS